MPLAKKPGIIHRVRGCRLISFTGLIIDITYSDRTLPLMVYWRVLLVLKWIFSDTSTFFDWKSWSISVIFFFSLETILQILLPLFFIPFQRDVLLYILSLDSFVSFYFFRRLTHRAIVFDELTLTMNYVRALSTIAFVALFAPF